MDPYHVRTATEPQATGAPTTPHPNGKKVWGHDDAVAAGRLGAAAAKAKKDAKKDADPLWSMHDQLTKATPGLVRDLLRAARGQVPWKGLPPEKRLAALFKALEYAAGRPGTSPKTDVAVPTVDDEAEEAPSGLSIA